MAKQYIFGSGSVWAANNIANPTPVRFGTSQNISLDFSANSKPLFGQNQLPVSVARGAVSVSGKITFAEIVGRIINELFFGGSNASGQIAVIDNESGSIPGTPYQITVANGATFNTDLGVIDATTGVPYVRVSSSPATGQYSVNTTTGVYTFASADTTKTVKISYSYGVTGSGEKLTINNVAMGQAATFKTVMNFPYAGKKASFTLNACVASKFSFASQLEDFMKPQFDFDAFTDGSDTLGVISVADVS